MSLDSESETESFSIPEATIVIHQFLVCHSECLQSDCQEE